MSVEKLACLGGSPSFIEPLRVGQFYLPSWESYETAFRDIFERQYYTNQGPLANKFEIELAQFLDVKHVVCVTNETIGLMMVAEALELQGRIMLPIHAPAASVQALHWAGLQSEFCKVSPATAHLDHDALSRLLAPGVEAILGVNLWGGSCDPTALEIFASNHAIQLFFDSSQALGCRAPDGRMIGCFGAAEVFSFHASQILSTIEGGGISTNNDALAEKLRNIRSSYGVRQPVKVAKTSNGRMSEAQAALGLLSLSNFDENRARNKRLHQTYQRAIDNIAGLQILSPPQVSESNYQSAVLVIEDETFGLSAEQLSLALTQEGLSVPLGACANHLQLPLGAQLDDGKILLIASLIYTAQQQASSVKLALGVAA